MRLRDAKKISAHKNRVGQFKVDYWKNIEPYNPVITFRGGVYTCTLRGIIRHHPNPLRLFVLVSELVNDVEVFQRQLVYTRSMANPLSDAVSALARERGVEIVPVPGFKSVRPQPLAPVKDKHPVVRDIVEHALNTHDVPEIDEYVHSSNIRDVDRCARGFLKLAELPPKPLDETALWSMFVDDALELPLDDQGEILVREIPEMTSSYMMSQQQTSSGAGLVGVSPAFGKTVGTKHEMQGGAASVNISDKIGTAVPGLLPFKPALKDEVIKITKDPRVILLESQPNYMVLKHVFGTMLKEVDPSTGIAIGLSPRGGDFKQIPFSWWMEMDCDYDDFIGYLKQAQVHESDKQAWEASTNETDGVAFLLHLLMRVDVNPADKKILARALADYFHPYVMFDQGQAYHVPWRVPSGSFLTSYGNTVRHRSMAKHVAYLLATNSHPAHLPRVVITDLEYRLMRRCFVQGDDYVGLCPCPEIFDMTIDYVFGTVTKTVTQPFFDGVEFLRRRFALDGNVIRTYRHETRTLAKLFKGSHTRTREHFCAALDCALREVGFNAPLFRLLYHMRYDAGSEGLEPNAYKSSLQRFIKKNPDIEDCLFGYVPTFADVINMDSSDLSPLTKVKIGRALEEASVPPKAY